MSGLTVLLVEDDLDTRQIYRMILEHYGYAVLEATDGAMGISMACDDRPDLILMDVSIPKIDGWQATRILKADERTKHIPILALTAHALAGDRDMAVAVGCSSFLPKPIEPRKVAEEVARFIGRPTPPDPPSSS
jgi:CheY-like chemotaxis protein